MITLTEGWYLNALSVGMRLHAGGIDASGQPAWLHLQQTSFHLVQRWHDADRVVVEAAVLYDVLLGGRTSPDRLRGLGIPSPTVELIRAVTPRSHDLSYMRWIEGSARCGKPDVLRILIAACMDRTDPARGYPETLQQAAGGALAVLQGALARMPLTV